MKTERSRNQITNPARKVLLIDDDESLRRVTEYSLHSSGFHVLSALDGEQGLASFQSDHPQVVITDIQMPGMSGYEVLRKIKAESPETLVIVITAYSSVEKAVEAMKQGAYDYLVKPFSRDELVMVVEKAFNLLGLQKENQRLRGELEHQLDFSHMVGISDKMQDIFEIVRRVAPTEASVLITGESGTGKELIARAIHQGSGRRNKPFLAINCAAIPANLLESELFGYVRGAFTGAAHDRAGKFEQADGGTLFLDEVGEMPMELQPKLLRVLQEMEIEPLGGKVRSIDVRIIAATNQEVEVAIEEGRFREDLYYRLSVIPIELPPLRERAEDIPLLIKHCQERFSAGNPVKISDAALDCMLTYSWPGNIRELQNAIERIVVLNRGESIELRHLPAKVRTKHVRSKSNVVDLPSEGYSLEAIVREVIVQALERNGWNKTKTANFLQVPRHTLNYRIEKYGIYKP
ncbi:MAG: sigma-54-dependent Fis family transcriptional regulator [Candidatus Zixiibacteriota bacterium]|nr:MAG: sigma-54-dependent Fis family transcriptional regulator [candidate division Zixibacteria bacterium]